MDEATFNRALKQIVMHRGELAERSIHGDAEDLFRLPQYRDPDSRRDLIVRHIREAIEQMPTHDAEAARLKRAAQLFFSLDWDNEGFAGDGFIARANRVTENGTLRGVLVQDVFAYLRCVLLAESASYEVHVAGVDDNVPVSVASSASPDMGFSWGDADRYFDALHGLSDGDAAVPSEPPLKAPHDFRIDEVWLDRAVLRARFRERLQTKVTLMTPGPHRLPVSVPRRSKVTDGLGRSTTAHLVHEHGESILVFGDDLEVGDELLIVISYWRFSFRDRRAVRCFFPRPVARLSMQMNLVSTTGKIEAYVTVQRSVDPEPNDVDTDTTISGHRASWNTDDARPDVVYTMRARKAGAQFRWRRRY